MSDALAGLNANMQLTATAAHNLANVNTNNYKALRSTVVEGPTGEPEVNTTTTPRAGSLLADGQQTSNVEIADEVATLITAQQGFEAALTAVTARDELLKDLMDHFKNH
ncbi:MAG: flagellar hook protein FlgE [Deltaproteobacteria bacterium ADurb.Bin510]|nr:MAG: flagellar hook protein FlgE [Deltaproteobacteria bacterium ADurb.Bin510]